MKCINNEQNQKANQVFYHCIPVYFGGWHLSGLTGFLLHGPPKTGAVTVYYLLSILLLHLLFFFLSLFLPELLRDKLLKNKLERQYNR